MSRAARHGQRNACSRLGEIDGDGAEEKAECGDNLEEDKGLQRDAPHAAQFTMAGDAGDDTAKDERGHHHADEP
jgi:hypothetical protein